MTFQILQKSYQNIFEVKILLFNGIGIHTSGATARHTKCHIEIVT